MIYLLVRAFKREGLKILVSFWVFGLSVLIGCSTDQAGRMESYLGSGVGGTDFSAVEPLRVSSGALKAGLVVINDTTGQDSAPPLSAPRLALMENLIWEEVEQDLPIQVVKIIPSSTISKGSGFTQLLDVGQQHEVEHLLFVVLSSEDQEEPTYLGQGAMMTHMTGVTFTNWALLEMALIDVKAGTLLAQAEGRGTEALEELDSPFGTGQPSKADARDILRWHAGKQALDRTLLEFREGGP